MGRAAFDGQRRRLLDPLRRHGLPFQRLLGGRRADRGRRHRRQRDPRPGAHAVPERELRGHPDHGDVELAPRGMAEVVPPAPRPGAGHDDLDQQLVRSEHGAPHAGEERGERDPTGPPGARDHRLGVQGHERRRHVGRGRGIAEVAAHGGQVPDLDGPDQGGALGQRRIPGPDAGVPLERPGGDRGPDPQVPAVGLLQALQRSHPGQVDHTRRLQQAVLELGQQVRPSRHQLRFGSALGQHADALVHAPGQLEIESSHASSSGLPAYSRPADHRHDGVVALRSRAHPPSPMAAR